jgi:hypothetical protein
MKIESMVPTADDFACEQKLYEKHKQQWVQQHAGDFVLIKGDKLVGFYPDYEDALREGLKEFGVTVPFFIKQVCAQEPVFTIY